MGNKGILLRKVLVVTQFTISIAFDRGYPGGVFTNWFYAEPSPGLQPKIR